MDNPAQVGHQAGHQFSPRLAVESQLQLGHAVQLVPRRGSPPPARSRPLLILSLFPGIDLLGRAFAELGHCVVAGPDLLWGKLVEDFRGIPDKFDGIIGGPPCVNYSDANRHRDRDEGDRLVREFLRVVWECRPAWWLMENVRACPWVTLDGYSVQRVYLDAARVGGQSSRLRLVQFGTLDASVMDLPGTSSPRPVTRRPCVTTAPMGAHDRYSRRCAAMGVKPIPLPHLTKAGRRAAIGNGVPMEMGRALARGVTDRRPVRAADCHCGCGLLTPASRTLATAACRQRVSRSARGHFRTLTYPLANDSRQ